MDCSQYEVRTNTEGYDPNWISCFEESNECICFHPNQGHENGPTDAIKNETKIIQSPIMYNNEIVYPDELPKTGVNAVGSFFIIFVFFLFIYLIIKKKV